MRRRNEPWLANAVRLAAGATLACCLGGAAQAQKAYITHSGSLGGPGNSMSVLDTATDRIVGEPITVGIRPAGVAFTPDGKRAYVVNQGDDNVAVIDTRTDTVLNPPIAVGDQPWAVAVAPDGKRVYVTNIRSVSVIDPLTNLVVGDPIPVGESPFGIAVSPDSKRVYVASYDDGTVSVINAETRTVLDTLAVGPGAWGVALTPDGKKLYVTDSGTDGGSGSVIDTATGAVTKPLIATSTTTEGVAVTPDGRKAYFTNSVQDTVSVLDTGTDAVLATLAVGDAPHGVAFTPDGRKAYVVNYRGQNVSVIDTASDTVAADTIALGFSSLVAGLFIQPKLFAGTPGTRNCAGQSLSAEARRYGSTGAAAKALGYGTVAKMQTAIRLYCAR